MHNTLVRSTQILNHILLLVGLSLIFFYDVSPVYLLYSLLTYWFIGVFGINIGYHRATMIPLFLWSRNRCMEIKEKFPKANIPFLLG